MAIAAALGTPLALDAAGPARSSRFVVAEGILRAGDGGATLLHDYGPFELYAVDSGRAGELRAHARGAAREQPDAIAFEASAFDPRSGRTDIPVPFRASKPAGAAVRLVQLAGPTVDAWLDEIRASGAHVVQYVPDNAYLILADAAQLERLKEIVATRPYVLHADTLDPWFKLNGRLAARVRAGLVPSRELAVTVLVATHPGNGASKAAIAAFGRGAPIRAWSELAGVESYTITVSEADLASLAQLPDVVAVEDYVAPQLDDEVQNQIVAGNFGPGNTGPSAPGYLTFLGGFGFSTTPADHPIVVVVDDGIGNGTIAAGAGDVALTRSGAGTESRIVAAANCTTSPNAGGVGGHGHINASIVGGYDVRAGLPFVDPNGYRRGQGLNPWVRLANDKIFTDAGGFSIGNCGGSMTSLIKHNQDTGAAISTNSWGAPVGGDYNADSRAYDIGTRDADGDEPGVQPLVFVFSAGNAGAGSSTIGSPSTAKNVITVGASENQRPNDESGAWVDGCGIGAAGADNAMDVISFSSRGPAEGGRIKPEVIAPGTHIQGTASTSTSPAYDGSGVCDGFRPLAQTVFAASSGTSHSAPAVAGVSSLVYRFLQTEHDLAAPSAAAVKAYLIAHPTYLTGVSGNGNLPTNSQGYGMPNLGLAFDGATDRLVLDQETTFSATGESAAVQAAAVDPARPVRIALAYSDAPGATSGSPVVNNLDLAVVNAGNTYRGNVFTGATSTTGGTGDLVNNYEAVFLPAGTSGGVEITVTAANIAGDAVPGNGDATDQDFALVCSNCTFATTFTLDATPESVDACGASGAEYAIALTPFSGFSDPVVLSVGGLPPGATGSFSAPSPTPPAGSQLNIATSGVAFGSYTVSVTGTSGATLRNDEVNLRVSSTLPTAAAPASPANGASGVSTTPTFTWSAAAEAIDYVVELDDDPAFTSINYAATVTGTSHALPTGLSLTNTYYWRVRARNTCGESTSTTFSFTTGALSCSTHPSTNVPLPIGPNGGTITNSTLAIAGVGGVVDVDVVGLVGTHTFPGDMDVDLVAPGGTTVRLFDDLCSGADNFDLNLDDAAAAVVGAACPLTGGQTVRPENPLAAFNGVNADGNWTLRITDDANQDGGSLNGWGLRLCAASGTPPVVANDDSVIATEDAVLAVGAGGVLGNDAAASALTASVVAGAGPANGTLDLRPDGSYDYTPAEHYCGPDSFVYQATDGVDTDTARVSIEVDCVNDAPVALDDAYVASEDTDLVVDAAAGVLDNDDDVVEGSPLVAVSASDPPRGSVVLDASGSLSYVPDANACGTDTFTYSANDGTDDSAPATVSIDVGCINDAPVAVADALEATEDTTLLLPAPGLLANDTDIEGSAIAPVFPTTPPNGSVVVSTNGAVTYVPAANFCGVDAFDYRITDAELFSGIVSVGITVACVDDAPVAVSDTVTVAEDAAATTVAVLANDTDVDAGPRSVASVTTPANGAAQVTNAGADVSFQPAADFCGSTSFSYALAGGSSGTVSVTVTCVNDVPGAAGAIPTQSRVEGQSYTLDTADDFVDPDGDTLAYASTGLPAGLAIDASSGAITGIVAIGAAAGSPYSVEVTATDPGSGVATQAFQFNVIPATDGIFSNGYE